MIALVGHVSAALSIDSKSLPVSDFTVAFGLSILFLSTSKTFGASVSQLPKAMHRLGSIDIW
jgi:hypothetical protein